MLKIDRLEASDQPLNLGSMLRIRDARSQVRARFSATR
jgi:hypothetical protein